MDKILNYFKNKSFAYFVIAGLALLSAVFAIVFFATYSNPTVQAQMGDKAESFIPEMIGIFLIAGCVVEIVVLVLPQYRFIHIIAVAMFGVAFTRDMLIIPDFIVGKINNVMYNHGNYDLNMFYFISLLVILIVAVAISFFGLYKDEEEAKEEMKVQKSNLSKIIKIGAGAVVVLAVILTSSLVSADLAKKMSGAKQQENTEPDKPKYDPITEDIKTKAAAYAYDFDPTTVIIKEQEEYDMNDSEMTSITTGGTRAGHNIVYYFEGAYSEGWQGDYSAVYGSFYLWEDGLFGGVADGTNVRGYWYNSSLANGKDEEGNDIKDCLNMVSTGKYESIITQSSTGFYQYQAYIYISKNGGRSMIITGYTYYPEVALFIDTSLTGTEFKVGDAFDRDALTANRVLKNLTYSAVYKSDEVTWNVPSGLTDANGKLTTAGSYTITASWNGLSASATITVAAAA